MSNQSTQAIAILNLPIRLTQDTPKGTWVTATGGLVTSGEAPIGVTQTDGKTGDMVTTTSLGTASMSMVGIASATVKQGDLIVLDAGAISVTPANSYATNVGKLLGVVLYDANPNGHAEVLIR
jgi:hypothetical protein